MIVVDFIIILHKFSYWIIKKVNIILIVFSLKITLQCVGTAVINLFYI